MIRLHLTDRHLRVMLWCILLGLQPAFGGILDPFNWARSDRIEVNIPWLPCKFVIIVIILYIKTNFDLGGEAHAPCHTQAVVDLLKVVNFNYSLNVFACLPLAL